ncbi:BLUF domain [Phaffia rhodozyma]|uniref:BLUF domain n=1 Tax=Phaffia rhodozyma TaxID=264483 RepID=A0A0F7SP70_PHARH|nr:BLUF domain [Phaffia rhodozyma]
MLAHPSLPVYCSTARITNFPQKELVNILETCRRANSSFDLPITGLLMYRDGQFVQFLEGRKQDVLDLYERISGDPRHYNVTTLFQRDTKGRDFGNWSMSFRDLERLNRGLPDNPENLPFSTQEKYESDAFNDIMLQSHADSPQFLDTMDDTIRNLITLYHKLFMRL